MANYTGIKGFKVQSLASDPSGPDGNVWYNTASNALKYAVVGTGNWASGGNMNTARDGDGMAGISSSSAQVGSGYSSAISAGRNLTEQYNGTSWSEVADQVNTVFHRGGAGTVTAALLVAGFNPSGAGSNTSFVEKWDGSTWTEVNNITGGNIQGVTVVGTTTAALGIGGGDPTIARVESYDGSSWTEGNDLQTTKSKMGGAGIQTAALIFGGPSPGIATESWNGTSWTEVNDLNTARGEGGGGGVQTVAMYVAGWTLPGSVITGNVETWDGTSWTEIANVGTARSRLGSCRNAGPGITTNSIVFGGTSPSASLAATEEFADPFLATKTVTVS